VNTLEPSSGGRKGQPKRSLQEAKRSIEWLIKRLIKGGAKVSCHGRMLFVQVASAFPLSPYYQAAFG